MEAEIVVTNAGIQEVINAEHNGTAPVVLTQVGLGTGQYTPSINQTALQNEFKRLPANALSGGSIGNNIIYINARDTSSDTYTLFEFGIYTSSGTLFAVCSKNIPILQKAAESQAYLDIEFVLANINPASVVLGDTNFFNPSATTEMEGVVELATDAETITGTDTHRAVTPAGLNARTADDTRTGLIQLATVAEVVAGQSQLKGVTPRALVDALKNIHDDYGYQKLHNGFIIQWGKGRVYDSHAVSSHKWEILFPTAFPTKCTNILAVPVNVPASLVIETITAGNFKASHNMNGYVDIAWLAIGF